MGQIKVTTNMPSLIVKIFDGDNHCTEKSASSKPIPFFKDADDNGSHETNETICIENLKTGLYSVRLCLPYFNGNREELGTCFPMPVVMDKVVVDGKDIDECIVKLAKHKIYPPEKNEKLLEVII